MTNPPTWMSVSAFFEALSLCPLYAGKRAIVDQFFKRIRTRGCIEETKLVFRFLFPEHDCARGCYKLKEKTLGKEIAKAFCLTATHVDTKRLLNYRSPNNQTATTMGNFVATAVDVFTKRHMPTKHIDVPLADVDDKFDLLAKATPEAREKFFEWACRRNNPKQFKWILYLILKDMRHGVSTASMLRMWHPDAQKVLNTTNDIAEVCKLTNPSVRIDTSGFEISVGTPIRPMLAERPTTLGHINSTIGSFVGDVYVQEKIDGERVQVHYCKTNGVVDFKFFSRNCHDLPALKETLAPFMLSSIDPRVTSFVLDGELVAVDSASGTVMPFGKTRPSVAVDPSWHPRFCAFDLLSINGISLISRRLSNRYDALVKHFALNDHFQVLPLFPYTSLADITSALDHVYATRGEGLVIKDSASRYLIGERHFCWTKVKVDYNSDLLETLDLVVIGAYYGSSHRSGYLSEFLLGVVDKATGTTSSICKVGTGLTYSQLTEVTSTLETLKLTYCPDNVVLTGKSTDRADVYFDPEASIVLEVQAAEIVPTTDYHSQVTLRFPRIRRIRHDKDYLDAGDTLEIRGILSRTGGRLTKPALESHLKRTVTKRNNGQRQVKTIVGNYTTPTECVVKSDGDLHGRTFYLAGRMKDAKTLQQEIVERGGQVIANVPKVADPTLTIVYEEKTSYEKTMLEKSGKHPLVHVNDLV